MRAVMFALILLWSQPGWAAIAYVTGATGIDAWDGGGATTIATSAWSLGSGHLVVACARWTTNVTVNSVTDTAGNTYSDSGVGRLIAPSGGGYTQMFYSYNTTANASNVVTFTFSASSTYKAVAATEYSGVKTSASPADTGSSGTAASSTTVTSGSFTPSETGTVAVACAAGGSGNGTMSAGTNYTERVKKGPSYDVIHMEDRLDAPASAQTASTTESAADWWAISVRAFTQAAASGGTILGPLIGVFP